jgi:Ca2+-binding RTX toxin-like protein
MGTALGFLLARTYDNRPRVWMEKLEDRRFFSVAAEQDPVVMLNDQNQVVATVQIINGVLTVQTTSGPDDMMIGSLKDDPDHLYVHVNYVRTIFARAGITGISVDLGDGDDAYVANNYGGLLNLPTTVNGGAGNDEISGEYDRNDLWELIPNIGDGPFAPAHFIGGEGNDTLAGGIGDTVVEGGPGVNRMFGRKGLFTILDAPPKEPTPVFVDDGGEGSMILLDDVVNGIFNVDSGSVTAVPIAGEAIATPTKDASGPAETSAAAVSKPPLAASAPASANPLLSSEGSLLGRRENEIWN